MVKNAQAHAFFQQLNQDLRHSAFGLPRLILDEDQLKRNIQHAEQQLHKNKHSHLLENNLEYNQIIISRNPE